MAFKIKLMLKLNLINEDSIPNVEDVFEAVYMLMHEFDPIIYPALF